MDVTDLKLATVALSSLSRGLMQAYEKERAWIARELHEDLCQRMMALTMRLHSLSELPGSAAGDMRTGVAELCGRFADLTGEILSISDRIHARLELLGLRTVARRFCEHLSAQHDAAIDFRDDGVPNDLSNDVALALFRVMQEALTNAMTHSAARHVSVSLDGNEDEIRLDVSDDGVGFDPDAAMKGHGLGLIGMRERLMACRRRLHDQFTVRRRHSDPRPCPDSSARSTRRLVVAGTARPSPLRLAIDPPALHHEHDLFRRQGAKFLGVVSR